MSLQGLKLKYLIKQTAKWHNVRAGGKLYFCARKYANQKMTEEFQKDEPVKYSTSKAKDFHSYETFSPPTSNMPWYQPPIIVASLLLFLTYFTMLREESDWDQQVNLSLYDRIPNLEETQLRQSIQHAASKGEDISALQTRLKEVIAAKNK